MICPKCSVDTMVKDSRPHREDARVVVRRRMCLGCGHRFSTQEGTIDIVAKRAGDLKRFNRRKASWTPEQRAYHLEARRLRRYAQQEAAATLRPLEDVLAAWKVPPDAFSPAPQPSE
jgi:transcriptional regulator NrdR family protein